MNSNYWLNLVAGNVWKADTSTPLPEKFYLGVSSKHPNKDGTGVEEPSGGGYARIELTGLKKGVEDGTVTNSAELRLPQSLSDWGVMTDWVIFDAQTEGHFLTADYFRNEADEPITRTLESGTTLVIRADTVKLWFKDDEIVPGG